jgi:hypothetical protein
MAKPTYTKPTSQLDLEARQKKDYVPSSVLIKGEDQPVSTNGFIGVDEVYQNYANATDAPMAAEGGAEAKIQKNFVAEDVDFTAGATPDGDSDDEDDDEDDEEPSGSTTPSSPPSPGAPA